MDDSEIGLEGIQAFVVSSGAVAFAGLKRAEVYAWVERTLVRLAYAGLSRADKGIVRRYVARMTGLSRAQTGRLIAQQAGTGHVRAKPYARRTFPRRYTDQDATLLAYVDKAHGHLSGPATRRILQREHHEYGQAAYQRLAKVSVAQIYRIRLWATYQKANTSYQPTRPTVIAIGQRRKPQPQGLPGYLRVDTVHQGDQDGVKGIYHINAVDEVTQWEIVAAVPHISEIWLMSVLEALLGQFPFVIRGFHTDNGSEYINYVVARLLEKLLIEQTKSRAHRSGDNGLVEAKNGAVIRKHLGHAHIGAQHAQAVNAFHRDHLNPYLNFHRPCAVPTLIVEPNGKRRRVYQRWATPFELLSELPEVKRHLRPGLRLDELARFAQLQSDTEAAMEMQRAKARLARLIQKTA